MATSAVEIAKYRELIRSGRAQDIRERAQVSRSELGLSIGVSQSTIWRWEMGKRIPRGAVARRYGEVLRELAEVGL
jgi:DNA-binding XRE family transcriptional regulator